MIMQCHAESFARARMWRPLPAACGASNPAASTPPDNHAERRRMIMQRQAACPDAVRIHT